MKNSLIICLLASLPLFFSCSSSSDPDEKGGNGNTDLTAESVSENITTQEDYFREALDELAAGGDTTNVLNSMSEKIKQDPDVEDAWVSDKIIFIKYKNRMISALVFEHYEKLDMESDLGFTAKKAKNNTTLDIPASHKVFFWDGHYPERVGWTDDMIDHMEGFLEPIGYEMTVELGDVVYGTDIEDLMGLDQYGMVHLYSHGIAYPNKDNISEIYLLTGSYYKTSTVLDNYLDDIISGDILLETEDVGGGIIKTSYGVSPEFIGKYNDFKENKTVFYGCFCFSNLGDWNKIANNFGASVYIGHTWSVEASWANHWAYDFYYILADTSDDKVYDVGDWETLPSPSGSNKYEATPECSMILPMATGDKSTTIWEMPECKVVKRFGEPAFDDVEIKMPPVANYGREFHIQGKWALNKVLFPEAQYSIIGGFVDDESKIFESGTFDYRAIERKEFFNQFDTKLFIPDDDKSHRYFKLQVTTRANNHDLSNNYFETRIYKISIFDID